MKHMENRSNENIKATEDEPVNFENGNENLKNVIGENLINEGIFIERLESTDSRIGESISKAYEEGPNPDREEDIKKGEEILERARKVIKEYDDTVGKITNNSPDVGIETNEDMGNNERTGRHSNEEIESVIDDYLNNKKVIDEKTRNKFAEFVEKEIDKPRTRRNVLKLMGGAAIALFINKDYILENINAWWAEFQEKENDFEIEYSEELTKLYEEGACLLPKKEKGIEDLKLKLDTLNESFRYVEALRNSEKKPLDEFITDLSKEEFDALLFGVRHNSPPETAAKILEGLIKKGKKFSQMDFEGLSITDTDDIEAVKKFNEGNLSREEMAGHIQESVDSILDIVKANSINISGTELNKGFERPRGFGRFTYISDVVEKSVRANQEKGIVGFYGGGGHVTLDNWNFSSRKFDGAYGEALEKNYTVKEYLEKKGFNPRALLMENMEQLADFDDVGSSRLFEELPESERNSFYEKVIEQWQNYLLKEKTPFASKYPDGKKNSFSVVIPGQIPPLPPQLNGFKTAYGNKYLSEILEKFDLRSMRRDDKTIKLEVYVNDKSIPFVDVDSRTGKVTKMYLPMQAKKTNDSQNNKARAK